MRKLNGEVRLFHVRQVKFIGIIFLSLLFNASTDSLAEDSDKMSLESEKLLVTCSEEGISVLSKEKTGQSAAMRIIPLFSEGRNAKEFISAEVIDNKKQINFKFTDGKDFLEGVLQLNSEGVIAISPEKKLAGIKIIADMAYGVVPSRWVDSIIYRPKKYSPSAKLHIPNENLLIGLVPGGNRLIALAWPNGKQSIKLLRDGRKGKEASFNSAEIILGEKNIYLGILEAPGIWHKIKHTKYQLENDIDIGWKKPFRAAWVTHFAENGVPTTYPFGRSERTFFSRNRVGKFKYPVWFKDDNAFLHLDKKIPPADPGEMIIFAPVSMFEFLKNCLSERERKEIKELSGSKSFFDTYFLKAPPAFALNFRCGGASRVRSAMLIEGLLKRDGKFLSRYFDNKVRLAIFVQTNYTRKWKDFIEEIKLKFREWTEKEKENDEVLAFLEKLNGYVKEMENFYLSAMDGKTPEENIARYKSLREKFNEELKHPAGDNLREIRSMISQVNGPLGVHLERLGAQGGRSLRKFFQQAAYASVFRPAALGYAMELRMDIREFLSVWNYETLRDYRPKGDMR